MLGNFYNGEILSFMRFLAKCRKGFGKVFCIFPFAKSYLVICDPVIVRRILSDTKTFIKGGDYKDVFSAAFGQGLVTSSGEKHKHDRAIFGKYFIRSNISKYVAMINDVAQDAINTKLVHPLDAAGGKLDTNIEDFFATLALRVFCQFSLNTSFKDRPEFEDKLCKVVSEGSFATAHMMVLNLPMWEIIPPVKSILTARRAVLDACKDAVATRRQQMRDGQCDDMDDCLTAMIRENMSEEDVLDHVMTLVCAGHDTTAYFSAFLTLLLAEHPDVQEKVRSEMLSVLGDREMITMEDIQKLEYLHKVMQETLRLYSVIPIVTREATEEVTIKEADNVTIPKGVNVMIPFYIMNRDPAIWDNPSAFDPDRFHDRSVEFTSAKNGYFPFGYGSRTCIGNTLAQTENAVFMCHLLRRFRFEALPGFKPAIFGGISLTTLNGVHVVIKHL